HSLVPGRAGARGAGDRCFVRGGYLWLDELDAALALLAAAEALATDAHAWGTIATTWRHPFGDAAAHARCLAAAASVEDVAADAPAARGDATVDELLRRGTRCAGWHRDANALFDHLRGVVSDDRLRKIAANDYGWQADENLVELRATCATGRIRRPLWQTLEVLQLERWGEPDSPLLDHASRALACT